MSKCPNCGAEFKFDVKSQSVHCDYCGSDFNPSDLKKEIKTSKAKENYLEGTCYNCTQCGATLMSFDETAVTFCSYCGSQNIMEDKMLKQTAPDFIIPFTKTKEECISNYKKKLSSFLFAPSYMKDAMVIKKIRGIYMPYGIYTLKHSGNCSNKGEKYSHRSGDYVYYDVYTIDASVDASYSGISFDLLSKFYDEYSQSIPFNFKEAEEFNPNYLPGFYADSKDVDASTYDTDAASIGTEDSTRFLKKEKIFKKYGCTNPKATFCVSEQKVGMFPVYFLATKSKDNEHLHYAVINGQTGQVAADIPISFIKYIIISLIGAAILFFVLNAMPIILPKVTNIFTILMAIAAWITCWLQICSCNDREGRYNDKGYTAKFSELQKEEKKDKKSKSVKKVQKYKMEKKNRIKYILAIVIPALILFLNPVSDLLYYFASSFGLLLILWSFNDLIKIHNQLVSCPIPQLEKRGGDESE